MKEKVIFDTNKLCNKEPGTFLGNRGELEQFSRLADIIIPDIVIQEIKKQKVRSLSKYKDSFLKNPFHWLRKLNEIETNNFDNIAHVNQLELEETISYTTIKLENYSILEQMKELATSYEAPFNKISDDDKNNSDKGFKDAYIYFTILEYLQTIPDKYIFVYTIDGRLKEALQKHPNIKIINSFEDFRHQSISRFYDPYFIDKIKEVTKNDNLKQTNIIDFWININGNYIIKLIDDETQVYYRIEVDSIGNEIIDWIVEDFVCNEKEVSILNEIRKIDTTGSLEEIINLLISSTNFSMTHFMIGLLKNHIQYLNTEEIEKILEGATNNSQIYRIIKDEDIRSLIESLYTPYKDIINPQIKLYIEQLLNKGLIKVDQEE